MSKLLALLGAVLIGALTVIPPASAQPRPQIAVESESPNNLAQGCQTATIKVRTFHWNYDTDETVTLEGCGTTRNITIPAGGTSDMTESFDTSSFPTGQCQIQIAADPTRYDVLCSACGVFFVSSPTIAC
ncbi:MAG: hypothetical protein OXM56_03035 [Gammaproteobacteria bacterium]|nr:hypothetical protein [Boseongicola sp.]MDE0348670.1 hypothetical protein [Gammaproteobacteria bacterium]